MERIIVEKITYKNEISFFLKFNVPELTLNTYLKDKELLLILKGFHDYFPQKKQFFFRVVGAAVLIS